MKKLALLLAASSALALAGPASANILTFDGDICNGGTSCSAFESIDQSYGDTAEVDVQLRYDSTGSADALNSLQYWPNAYNELINVAFGVNNPNTNGASIFFAPISGYQVTLDSFNIGAWLNREGAPSEYTIFDGLGATLFSSGSISVGQPGNLSNFYIVGLTSANGIGLKWGPESYNVGVDNVSFSASRIVPIDPGGVPEPATWAMMLAGFGLIGAAMRRRQKVAVRYAF